MLRIRSPFGLSANPDSNRAAFPPPFSPVRLPCPLLTPIDRSATLADRPLANRPPCFVSPPFPAGSRPARDPRLASRVLGKPGYSQSGISFARTHGSPGVLLDYFPRVTAESTPCAAFQWPGLPTVLRPRPRACCLYSVFVHQPAFLRPASFIQPSRNQTLPFATLAAIQPGVELIACIAPPYLAMSSAIHGGTRHKQRINK